MTPFRAPVRVALVAALMACGGSARAGWSNVFQVCCDSCKSTVSGYAAAVPVSDGCQQCQTKYVQRSYYQPVTTYQTSYYYQPVTSYRTSYYYEPVTSYRYSAYYDPCSCGYQQVATPVTSYRLRSQCCPVTSYLQRTMVQPVTNYQLSYYYEPQTTCCQTTIGAPVAAPPAAAVAVPVVPQTGAVAVPAAPQGAPSVNEQRQPQLAVPPGVSDQREPAPAATESQRYPAPASNQPMPKVPEGATYRSSPYTPPSVRLDRIVSASTPNLEGQVVREDRQPVANAQLLFVLADRATNRETVTADAQGKFQVSLAAGTWLVYTQTADGKTDFRRKVDVRNEGATELRLVSR